MGDVNEYQKLIESPTKHEKVVKGRWTDAFLVNAINQDIPNNIVIGIYATQTKNLKTKMR
jgi:hypothetical protein